MFSTDGVVGASRGVTGLLVVVSMKQINLWKIRDHVYDPS
jgi:hypothetical protein